jgi:protein ATS1
VQITYLNPVFEEVQLRPGMLRHLCVFGSNGEGQLGIPAAEIVDTPTLVPNDDLPLLRLRSITGGDNHTLVTTDEGTVYGVGDNRKAQLVPDSEQTAHVDAFTKLNSGVAFVAATCESSAYITFESSIQTKVHIQGSGQWGELGHGDDATNLTDLDGNPPSPFILIPGTVVDFAAGVWHYVAVSEDGSVYGWGKARLGQLGEKLSGKVSTPTKIEGINFKATRVICGKDFTYLVGDPSTGEHIVLGKDKFNIVSAMPQDIKGWKDIGATWHAIFVLFDDGKLIAWGRSAMWELIPPGLPLIDKIAVGSEHVLAITREGKLISWGWGKHGNCGNLTALGEKVKNDMVSGFWNEIELPGEVDFIGAGFCTSFAVIKVAD